MQFSQFFPSKAYCILRCKKFGCHFTCQSLLLSTSVPNDIKLMYLTDYGSTNYKSMDHVICAFDCSKNDATGRFHHCNSSNCLLLYSLVDSKMVQQCQAGY